MCNQWCLEFANNSLSLLQKPARILEVGSRNVNGSIRDVLSECTSEYIGVDLFEGPGVDVVCDVAALKDTFLNQSFDLVVSTEMLEHCLNWQDALYQMASVLRQDGLLFITTRSPGFELHDYPADHWRFSYSDFEEIFQPLGEVMAIKNDMTLGWPCGIGILVKRKLDQSKLSEWKSSLEEFDVYSMENEISSSKSLVNSRLDKIIFDQYSRYKACSDLLRQAEFSAGDSVLDIGSGPECLFGQFMPDASMNYVDPLIPLGSGQGHITGNIFASELDGQAFDCVSAVDVFEHVPPESRQAFLERMSSLGKNTLILGFPTSDSSDALEVDKAIDDQYRAIFGHEYSWLEEHYRFGLPSLSDTVNKLQKLGWHCQTVGHGHAPWLIELLGFVICTWEISSLKEIVLDISEKFNRTLYPFDYRPPYYRQFIIATRDSLSPVALLTGEADSIDAEEVFQALMEEARSQYFIATLHQLKAVTVERDMLGGSEYLKAIDERDNAISERDNAISERDNAISERDKAIAERDNTLALLNMIESSASWRLTKPLRFGARLARHGFVNEDKQRIYKALRHRYHSLPMPARAKKIFSFTYHRVIHKAIRSLQRNTMSIAPFHAPLISLVAQQYDKPDYIIWGVIDWHFRYQRPQQLAQALALTGRRIFYIAPILVDDERAGFDVEGLGATNQLFQIKLFAKNANSIYSDAPGLDTVAQLRQSIGEVLNWADSKQIVSLVDHPFWFDIASVLPNSRLIYDCMDHHEGFGNNAESLLQLEKRLLSEANLTITTSSWLDEAIAPHATHSALIRNACDFEHFAKVPDSLYRDLEGRRIIGYYGAIAEWFDLDLVEAIAKHHPNCSVLLIGADTINAKKRLSKLPNVEFTGEIPYDQLPHYLHGFDVCLLPFKVIPLTLATNPVKVYEYLSAGKPVVSVDLPEIVQFKDLVYSASDRDTFVASVSEVLSRTEPKSLEQQRKIFAEGQTWQHRAESVIEYAESFTYDPKVSVIVVTFNNLDLTHACLESLDQHSQYEHLEIIVVDNASSDGSPAFLSEWVTNGQNRKLILNDDNRGFAAANNQGLKVATGEYLVLLNNDTYVTPGWVRTLVSHLQRESSIGLIGPVTNNIGNEAKIDIHYADMDEMLVKSSRYTHKHIGQTYPLRTAAFFCVMMPRTTYERVGTLDEAFGRGFFEDDDYCRRIEQLGLRVVCAEDVFIHHQLSASFDKIKQQDRQKLFEDNKKTYEAKWGEWLPHGYRKYVNAATVVKSEPTVFYGQQHIDGQCNVCGEQTRFFYQDVALWRESLNCEHCRTTSRYRSITKGVLRAINELNGSNILSLAMLPRVSSTSLHVYDTQPPFYYESCAYPLPDLMKATGWIDIELSQYKPKLPMGKVLSKGVTNQNLECLTFADESLDIVITSDVMEHVRLDDCAHSEIYRVLKPGGVYIFTVPHNRAWEDTLIRVQIIDPDDPSKDVHLLEPEYHGDTNSDEGGGVLAYRTYGRDIEVNLTKLGFQVEYFREDDEQQGILNTELYYCKKPANSNFIES